MTDKGLLILNLDSPVQPRFAGPDFDAQGRWATLFRGDTAVGTFWTDANEGFGFLSTGSRPDITKEIRFYIQTSANANVSALVAYGTALSIFPEKYDLTVHESIGTLGQLFGSAHSCPDSTTRPRGLLDRATRGTADLVPRN